MIGSTSAPRDTLEAAGLQADGTIVLGMISRFTGAGTSPNNCHLQALT